MKIMMEILNIVKAAETGAEAKIPTEENHAQVMVILIVNVNLLVVIYNSIVQNLLIMSNFSSMKTISIMIKKSILLISIKMII
jgi:hypothetical protein